MTVTDLHDIVHSTLQILSERVASPQQQTVAAPLPPAMIQCHPFKQERAVKMVRHHWQISKPFTAAHEAIQRAKASQTPQEPAPQKVSLE